VPSPINTIAGGLLSMLGSKGQGGYPSALLDTVAPMLEIKELYLAFTRESIGSAAQAAAVGAIQFLDLAVPSGELWYVWEYAVAVAPGAGAAARIAPAFQNTPVSFTFPTAPYQAAAATENIRVPSTRQMLWSPGTVPGCLVQSQTLAPNVTGAALITRLKV
jgi:hypothetical protein